jgi:nucleotide-binding universal stress UspA family protein
MPASSCIASFWPYFERRSAGMHRETCSGMKRILVCLDASPRASLVLETARGIAQSSGAKLCLLRAVGLPPEVNQEMLVHSAATVIETMMGNAQNELNDLARKIPANLLDGVHVHIGTPWDTICKEAKALDCELVVIGSHGYSGFDRILGTTAGKVVNHCDRSVLVVRQPPRIAS